SRKKSSASSQGGQEGKPDSKPEGEGKALSAVFADTGSANARKDVEGLFRKYFTDEKERKNVVGDLDKFESRAAKEKLTEKYKEHFYNQLGRVLREAGEGNKLFTAEEVRGRVADMAHHAAEPGSVNQGSGPTCTAAALEAAMYKKEPGVVAELVADVMINGEY